ncbi:MAG: hypothetical protein ACLF0P_17065 [Thermoanaerobaculia bacterium]
MTPERKIVVTVIAACAAVLLVLLLWPRVQEGLAPEPVAAHVAILPEGREAAVTGPVEIAAGTSFTLHAVLEAEGRGGQPIYYTQAPALEIDGRRAPDEALRRWDRRQVVKLFWFSVEGFTPYLDLKSPEQLERFHFTEFFRPEWPATWSVEGRLTPRFSQGLIQEGGDAAERPFGTQRYQVRIELFDDEEDVTPNERFISTGSNALPEQAASFPTVYSALAGPAGPASLAFGLTQVEPSPGAGGQLRGRLAELTERRVAFARTPLLRDVLAAAGVSRGELRWEAADLSAGPSWGEGAGAVERGDLVRAGSRVVVLYEDRGTPGVLDHGDLVFDYQQGAAVRALSEVFAGEGRVELARITGDLSSS